MKATFFIRPSVRRFFQFTFNDSKRAQAASRSSTETPAGKAIVRRQSSEKGATGCQLTDVTKALGLRVSVVVDLALLLFSAVVPGQLQHTLPFRHGVLSILLNTWVRSGVSQEVEVESSVLVLNGPQ